MTRKIEEVSFVPIIYLLSELEKIDVSFYFIKCSFKRKSYNKIHVKDKYFTQKIFLFLSQNKNLQSRIDLFI